jgi:hypothetical protein
VVVTAGVLRVTLPIVGVGDKLGIAAFGAVLATAWASAEAVVAAASVKSDGAAIAPLAKLVIRVECGVLVGVALSYVEQVGN